MSKTELNLEILMKNSDNLTQFILDPTSFNLSSRVYRSDPVCQTLFKRYVLFNPQCKNEEIERNMWKMII